jgi:hypothetical protein
LERFNKAVSDVVFLKNRQAREHREIVHIGRTDPHRANYQPMLRIGRTLEKPFEIHRASRAADLGGIHLLQTKDVRFESFKLWPKHSCPLLKGGAVPARTAEAFEIEGG